MSESDRGIRVAGDLGDGRGAGGVEIDVFRRVDAAAIIT
jgi:hypothetical protein